MESTAEHSPGASTDSTAVLAATREKEDHQQVLCAEVLT